LWPPEHRSGVRGLAGGPIVGPRRRRAPRRHAGPATRRHRDTRPSARVLGAVTFKFSDNFQVFFGGERARAGPGRTPDGAGVGPPVTACPASRARGTRPGQPLSDWHGHGLTVQLGLAASSALPYTVITDSDVGRRRTVRDGPCGWPGARPGGPAAGPGSLAAVLRVEPGPGPGPQAHWRLSP
jgi:hypothetical protein